MESRLDANPRFRPRRTVTGLDSLRQVPSMDKADIRRVKFIAVWYGKPMAERMREVFESVADEPAQPGFTRSVRASIDREIEQRAASGFSQDYLKEGVA
jgi:hypothetical protein